MSIEAVENFITNMISQIEKRAESVTGELTKFSNYCIYCSSSSYYSSYYTSLFGWTLAEIKNILDSLNALKLPGTLGSVINSLDNIADVASPAVNAVNTVQDAATSAKNTVSGAVSSVLKAL